MYTVYVRQRPLFSLRELWFWGCFGSCDLRWVVAQIKHSKVHSASACGGPRGVAKRVIIDHDTRIWKADLKRRATYQYFWDQPKCQKWCFQGRLVLLKGAYLTWLPCSVFLVSLFWCLFIYILCMLKNPNMHKCHKLNFIKYDLKIFFSHLNSL